MPLFIYSDEKINFFLAVWCMCQSLGGSQSSAHNGNARMLSSVAQVTVAQERLHCIGVLMRFRMIYNLELLHLMTNDFDDSSRNDLHSTMSSGTLERQRSLLVAL